MDENRSPQDFLNEIFERSQMHDPAPPSGRPAGGDRNGAGGSPLPWLCVALGAAALVLGVCLFQMSGLSRRLDALEQAVEALADGDALREENERLRRELDGLREQAAQAGQDRDDLREERDRAAQELNVLTVQKWQRDYLFYIGQFMDSGDYPLAALAVVLSADRYFDPANLNYIPTDPAQAEQYRAYRQELIEKGYLERVASSPIASSTVLSLSERGDPEKDPDMAALGILWCALEAYYVTDDPDTAAQYLVRYQWYALAETGDDRYPQRILDTASDHTVRLYQQLIQDLTKTGWLTERDGTLLYNEEAPSSSDVLYSLPFDPPGDWLYGEIPLT